MAGANVSFRVDDGQLRDFDRRLTQVGRAFDRSVTGRVLRVALKPTLAAIRRNAPIGERTRSGKGRTSRDTTPDRTYDRGGATKRDARIRIVNGVGNEVVRGLAGISKSRGRVGWRTHFITRGTANRYLRKNKAFRGRITPNDFLGRSERETEGQVEAGFLAGAETVVTKIISKP